MTMDITFHAANFKANLDEQIFILGNTPELGNGIRQNAIPLQFTYKNQFVTITFSKYESGTYRYFTKNQDDVAIHYLPQFKPNAQIILYDDLNFNRQTPWYSSVFEVISSKTVVPSYLDTIQAEQEILVRTFVPYPVEKVAIISSIDWNLHVPLIHIGNRQYEAKIKIVQADFNSFEYKFVINDQTFEQGPNRRLNTVTPRNCTKKIYIFSSIFNYAIEPQPKIAGINIPIFSLRSKESIGCGEFADLKIFSDLAAKSGIRVIQIIPVNDTISEFSWRDAQPYNGISVFGMHVMYLRLQDVQGSGEFKDLIENARVECKGEKMAMDYDKTVDVKMDIMRKIWNKNYEKLSASVQSWIDNTPNISYWIYGYSVFKYLHELNRTTDFNLWKKMDFYDPEQFKLLNMDDKQIYIRQIFNNKKLAKNILFYAFIQQNLDIQLYEAALHARQKGVFFKGDIPIGVHPCSVDTWERTDLFNMDTSTGAPPDQFSATGQNWDFPTYNWDAMRHNNDFEWWTRRFQAMERYFDSFRIDHVLGWFRIWEIPGTCCKGNGRLGHFAPCDPIAWDTLQKLGIWDVERLTRPLIDEQHCVPKLISSADFQFLVSKNFLVQDLQFGGFNLKFSERETVRLIENMKLQEIDFQRVKNSVILLSSNRCFTKDRLLPDVFCHPIFCNTKIDTETISFSLLPQQWKVLLRTIANDYFYKAHQDTWANSANIRLPIIGKSSQMLIIGEDLGLLAPIVPQKMKEHGLLGFRVHNMPSDPEDNFQKEENYTWMTVCTPGTHDCPTVRYWWDSNKKQVQLYWKECFNRTGDGWKAQLSVQDSLNIVRKHLHTQSMIAMFLWQDWAAITENTRFQGELIQENINNPALSDWYWCYRMPENIEHYIENDEFCQLIKHEISTSGRL